MLKRAPLVALILAAFLAGCGLGRDNGGDGGAINDPVVAATVNGRPIYIEDVRAHAVARGLLQEGEDLDANSDAFFFALEELIQVRLFAMEAEARGLDRDPHVRRQLENARERVLAASIYEEIDQRAVDPAAIERLYRENSSRLGGGQEVRLRMIRFATREEADSALRRLNQGERFEALAFELSTERNTAPDGGDLGFRSVGDLLPPVRDAVEHATVGDLLGPIEIDNAWHVMRLEDRREGPLPSLETLRPRIVDWMRFQEISTLHEELERGARIVRMREREQAGVEPGGEVTEPGSAQQQPEQVARPAPDAGAAPGAAPPPFPFPMGGGAQTPARPAQQPQPAPVEPPPAAPAPSP
jgi:peptidyl-prolyl cis-trans isomerase C